MHTKHLPTTLTVQVGHVMAFPFCFLSNYKTAQLNPEQVGERCTLRKWPFYFTFNAAINVTAFQET